MHRCNRSEAGLSLVEMMVVLFIAGTLLTAIIWPLSRRARDERALLLEIEEILKALKPGDCYSIDNDENLLWIQRDIQRDKKRISLRTLVTQGARSACLGESGYGLYTADSGWSSPGTCFRGTTTASGIRVCINSFGIVYRYTNADQ